MDERRRIHREDPGSPWDHPRVRDSWSQVDSVFIALLDSPIELVLCKHEQNASFMAQAMGRMTGTIGVCIATSGPGVTNLVTGLATATPEGDPVLAIGGEVSTDDRYKHCHQSLDAISLMEPVTKYAKTALNAHDLPEVLGNAIRAAEHGRRGAAFLGRPVFTKNGSTVAFNITKNY